MAQEMESISQKATHGFSAVFCCRNLSFIGGAVILFKLLSESDAEESGYFWKLEQFAGAHDIPVVDDNEMEAFGCITKVLIDENSYTKVRSTWRAATLALDDIYKRIYANYNNKSIDEKHPYSLPLEKTRHLVGVAFTLRYSEEQQEDAPLQLNISVDGNELPGTSHVGVEINLRTSNKVVREDVNGQTEKQIGGVAVLTQNPDQVQIREIDEQFTKYLLRKFGSGHLKEMFYVNKSLGNEFCSVKNINTPFKRSCFCCVLL